MLYRSLQFPKLIRYNNNPHPMNKSMPTACACNVVSKSLSLLILVNLTSQKKNRSRSWRFLKFYFQQTRKGGSPELKPTPKQQADNHCLNLPKSFLESIIFQFQTNLDSSSKSVGMFSGGKLNSNSNKWVQTESQISIQVQLKPNFHSKTIYPYPFQRKSKIFFPEGIKTYPPGEAPVWALNLQFWEHLVSISNCRHSRG